MCHRNLTKQQSDPRASREITRIKTSIRCCFAWFRGSCFVFQQPARELERKSNSFLLRALKLAKQGSLCFSYLTWVMGCHYGCTSTASGVGFRGTGQPGLWRPRGQPSGHSHAPALQACERPDAPTGDLPDAGWQKNQFHRRAEGGF